MNSNSYQNKQILQQTNKGSESYLVSTTEADILNLCPSWVIKPPYSVALCVELKYLISVRMSFWGLKYSSTLLKGIDR